MDISVRTAARSRVPVLHVRGALDLNGANELRAELFALDSSDGPHAVVDLSDVTFIDSTGLGVLTSARTAFSKHGGTVTLVIHRESVLRVFRISSLVRLFTICPTLEGAMSAVAPSDDRHH